MHAATVHPSELTPEQKKLLTSPYGFGRHYLGLPIYDQPGRRKVGECKDHDARYYEIFETDCQKRVLDDIDQHGSKVAVRTCNGAGKTTTLIPTSAFWFMAVHPRAKVVITSGVDRQVREQIFPALHAHRAKLTNWRFNDTSIDAPNGSHCVGFTTRDGGHFEGWHGNKNEFYDLLQHDGPLMIIVDEAKSVPQTIFDAIERCTFQRLLLASSCGSAQGAFYDAFHKAGAYYRGHQIAATECPHADHAKNLELIQRRGLEDPLVKSKVFAEFMGSEVGAVIRLEWLPRCTASAIEHQPETPRYFCDFAQGGDENVIAECNGNRTRIVAAWRERDSMRACGEFILQFRKLGLTPSAAAEHVTGDNGGGGHVMIDRLHELGWQIQRDNAGAAADEPDHYTNRSAETWFEAAKKIERGQIILPDDEILTAQLVSRSAKPRSDGRLQLESKEDMRKRGVGSPDRADALLGALRTPRQVRPINFSGNARDLSFLRDANDEQSRSLAVLTGAACE